MNLTEKDIEFGFWYFKTRKPVFLNYDDSRIKSEKNLGLGFYDESNSSKEIKEWNKKLESLTNVEYLWTYHKLNQETFEKITRMRSLKGLNIKWSSIKSLEPIEGLQNIEHLHLGLSTNIYDLKSLKSLKNLITLETENLKKVKDWDVVGELDNLKGLGINGGMYEALKLNSIEFLKNLTTLKYLFLINTSVKNNSLKPIENLKQLQCIRLSNRWKEEQFENLRIKLPNLEYGNVALDKKTKNLNSIFRKKKN
jgi:hypothetical protein